MSHPIWETEAGSLGVVPEGKFYRVALEAYDPDFPTDPTKVTYVLIAGALPAGVQLATNGTIEGIPISVADFKGVPAEVSENTTAKFAIRVTDVSDRIADRTFTITVSGQDAPEFVTPAGSIGTFFDGSELNFQFEVFDSDPNDILTVTLISGSIPPTTSIDSDGLFSGFLDPVPGTGATQGFDRDGTPFDALAYDFNTGSVDIIYQFTLQVSDGKDVSLRTFEIEVLASAVRVPYLLEHETDIGIFRHDNYFVHQFIGADPDGEIIEYLLTESTTATVDLITADNDIIKVDSIDDAAKNSVLPYGITLDTATGWISGVLSDVGLTTVQYDFGIIVRKVDNPTVESVVYDFTITVIGDIEQVTWITDTFLGIINNGDASTFTVEAVHENEDLTYSIATGTKSKLPQGLQLLPSGDIVGRASFKTFSLDSGTTTFDSEHGTRLDADPTTFDLLFRFTVEATSVTGFVSVSKEFVILVNREYNVPYNILYCKAMPPIADRNLIDTLLLNEEVFDPAIIYRIDDPIFGVATEIVYPHAYGLSPGTLTEYFAALSLNHYNKVLTLGSLKTARALDENDNILYEVVYSEIIDDLVNPEGQSTAPVITTSVGDVYPNSLENMREQVIDIIGQESKVLPQWMLSKQENGETLGFTAAWVLAYTIPEKSELLKYNISEFFGEQLNLIDFEIDRYSLDYRLSRDWDLVTPGWVSAAMTTFDRVDYLPGDPGYITPVIPPATSSIYAKPRDLSPYDIITETVFDGESCRFLSPVDVYDATDEHDRYIKFPQTSII